MHMPDLHQQTQFRAVNGARQTPHGSQWAAPAAQRGSCHARPPASAHSPGGPAGCEYAACDCSPWPHTLYKSDTPMQLITANKASSSDADVPKVRMACLYSNSMHCPFSRQQSTSL